MNPLSTGLLAGILAALPAAQGSIVINEFLARNTSGIQDEVGQFEDWIELANTSTAPVTVSGMYMTDRPANLTKWQIPAGFTLQPGARLLIWADEDGSQGPLHANFKLAAGGEDLLLVATDGTTILQQLQFGPQQANISTGRFRDGDTHWVTFPDPSPAMANGVDLCGAFRYSGLDSALQTFDLNLAGTPQIGQSVTFQLRGGDANTIHAMLFSAAPQEIEIPGVTTSKLLLAPPLETTPSISSNAQGEVDIPVSIPNTAALVGAQVVFQGWTVIEGNLEGSNGLAVIVCQ